MKQIKGYMSLMDIGGAWFNFHTTGMTLLMGPKILEALGDGVSWECV